MKHNRDDCADGCDGWLVVGVLNGLPAAFPCPCVCHRPFLSNDVAPNADLTQVSEGAPPAGEQESCVRGLS